MYQIAFYYFFIQNEESDFLGQAVKPQGCNVGNIYRYFLAVELDRVFAQSLKWVGRSESSRAQRWRWVCGRRPSGGFQCIMRFKYMIEWRTLYCWCCADPNSNDKWKAVAKSGSLSTILTGVNNARIQLKLHMHSYVLVYVCAWKK